MGKPALISARRIEKAIVIVRGVRVLLDADLAPLYGVTTRELVQAVNAIGSGSRKTSCCS